MLSSREQRAPRIVAAFAAVRAVLLVAATYTYFLLFAQYGLVRLLQDRLGAEGEQVRVAMSYMAVAGLLSSLMTGRLLASIKSSTVLRLSFAGCSLAALAATMASSFALVVAIGAMAGGFLGMLTVTLATGLRSWAHPVRLGVQVGLGTGLAYAICNLPVLFDGDPGVQALVSALVAAAGVVLTTVHAPPGGEAPLEGQLALRSVGDARSWGFATLVLSFLALIWLDSAAFNIIQETVALKGVTWAGSRHLLAMGTTHLLAAVLAGLLIDLGYSRSLLLAAFALFVVSFSALQSGGGVPVWVGPLYAVGISLYSTLLVAYPSLHPEATADAPDSGETSRLVPRRWRAAAVYGVGGWLGSALGVGMAQDLHRIPPVFLWSAGAVLAIGALSSVMGGLSSIASSGGVRGLLKVACVILVGTATVQVVGSVRERGLKPEFESAPVDGSDRTVPWSATADAARVVAHGRAVYIQEGCINCHSQFLRPRVAHDLDWWGPYRPLDRDARPPLIGNRRQGPDLLNAGNRRSADWHRQHLVDPRSVSPGSRMPSYARLFSKPFRWAPSRPASRRPESPPWSSSRLAGSQHPSSAAGAGSAGVTSDGEALVSYLSQLGARTATRRFQAAQARNVGDLSVGDVTRGRRLFERYCSACHGSEALGDGPVSRAVFGRALNLRKDVFWLPTWGDGDGTLKEGLARLVRYGVASTNMPGHEWLSDRQLANLVAYLVTLPGTDRRPPPEDADAFVIDEFPTESSLGNPLPGELDSSLPSPAQ